MRDSFQVVIFFLCWILNVNVLQMIIDLDGLLCTTVNIHTRLDSFHFVSPNLKWAMSNEQCFAFISHCYPYRCQKPERFHRQNWHPAWLCVNFWNISIITVLKKREKEWIRMSSVVIIMHDHRRGIAYAQLCPTLDVFSVNFLASQQRKDATGRGKRKNNKEKRNRDRDYL